MPARARRWWRLLALVAFALVAVPATAVRAADEPAPLVEGPWIIEAGPDVTIIVDDQGNVVMTGDAPERVDRCEAQPGCATVWDDGIGAALILVPVDDAGVIDAAVQRAESGEALTAAPP